MNLKKLVLPLLAVMALVFSSCNDKPAAFIESYYVTVKPGDWSRQTDMGYLYTECPLNALDGRVIDNGFVSCYFIDQYGYDNQLPYLLPYYTDDGLFWENIRYDVSQGKITFIIQESDMFTDLTVNNDMKFKVCVVKNY